MNRACDVVKSTQPYPHIHPPTDTQEKRPVTALQAVPEWNALLCLVDGTLVAYALATFKPLAVLPESKGCVAYHHNATAAAAASGRPALASGSVAVVLPKRRLLVADWESRGGGGAFRVRVSVLGESSALTQATYWYLHLHDTIVYINSCAGM